MSTIIRTVVLGLGLQFLFAVSISAAEDELTAQLPETMAGMVRLDLHSNNIGLLNAIGEYDANGDGKADIQLSLIYLGDHADMLRLYQEVNIAEGRLMAVSIAGLAGAESELNNERATTQYVAVVAGRICVEAVPHWKAKGVITPC